MAGEIQIGGTTFATESGGTVTVANVNSATNRTNLGLGSIATQNANGVALTGGRLKGSEFDLKSSGTTVYASDGTTSIISESSGTVTINNATLDSTVTFPSIGQLVFWHGHTSNSTTVTCTFDRTSYYTVICTGRHNTTPFLPKNLTFIINSLNGVVSNKTDDWSTALNESYNASTGVLSITSDSDTEFMNVLIFKGAITEMT